MKRLRRTLSEPQRSAISPTSAISSSASTICRIYSSSISREVKRSTNLTFEQVKDQIAVSINKWTTREICSFLLGLVQRCNLNQMTFLWTALESIPHKDFLHQATREYPTISFQPLSTPISREFKTKLQRSRYPENKSLHRTQSVLITHSSIPISTYSVTEATPLSLLPGLPLTSIGTEETTVDDTIRLCSPTRRHMTISPSNPGNPSSYHLPAVKTDAWSTTQQQQPSIISPTSQRQQPSCDSRQFSGDVCSRSLPYNGMTFLKWFSNLEKDWQRHEILQLLIWYLNQKELYYLAILLLSRQYKDFICDLTPQLSQRILCLVSGKDILLSCLVSERWYNRCTNETLWKIKCGQIQLGLPAIIRTTWRQLYIDNIKLRRNWRLGKAQTLTITKHRNRVLCVRIKETEGICGTGSNDHTIRIWRLKDGKLINTISEYGRVWSLCFYGLNFIISGCSDGLVKIWQYRTGKLVKRLEKHTGTIWTLQQKRDMLITGSYDKMAILWNIRHCRYNKCLVGHRGAVFTVDINDDCSRAYTGSGDKTIRIWDTANGACVRVINESDRHTILSLHYNKSYLVYCSGTCVYLWSLDENKLIYKLKGHRDRVEAVNLQRTGSNCNTIISCGRDGLIKYWNSESGRCIRTLGPLTSPINSIDRDSIRIVSGSENNSVTIWDFDPLTHINRPSTTATTTCSSINNKLLTDSINMFDLDVFNNQTH